MPFADYTSFIEPLALPYAGKVYEIPPVGIQDTIRLSLAADPETTDQLPDEEYERILLGAAGVQMRADNVPDGFFARVLATAYTDFRYGRDMAEAMWATGGGSPKAMTDWLVAHKDSTPSPATDEATETPRPASTSGTRTSRAKRAPSKTETPPAE